MSWGMAVKAPPATARPCVRRLCKIGVMILGTDLVLPWRWRGVQQKSGKNMARCKNLKKYTTVTSHMLLDRKFGSKDSFVYRGLFEYCEWVLLYASLTNIFVWEPDFRIVTSVHIHIPSIFYPYSRASMALFGRERIPGFEVVALAAAPFFGWCHASQGREALATRSDRLWGPTSLLSV